MADRATRSPSLASYRRAYVPPCDARPRRDQSCCGVHYHSHASDHTDLIAGKQRNTYWTPHSGRRPSARVSTSCSRVSEHRRPGIPTSNGRIRWQVRRSASGRDVHGYWRDGARHQQPRWLSNDRRHGDRRRRPSCSVRRGLLSEIALAQRTNMPRSVLILCVSITARLPGEGLLLLTGKGRPDVFEAPLV
jgi:hypothetical protein